MYIKKIIKNSKSVSCLMVDKKATKPMIRKELLELFPEVTINSIRTINVKPRKVMFKRKPGVRKGYKKIYFTIKHGIIPDTKAAS